MGLRIVQFFSAAWQRSGVRTKGGLAAVWFAFAMLALTPAAQSACAAGFKASAQQGSGAVTLQPIIQGVATGMTYNVNAFTQYTLRVRVHCTEIEQIGR